jgi:FemAB-related protein (PEP-CTERM system-associated)
MSIGVAHEVESGADRVSSDVALASDGDVTAWDAFVSRCPQATGYHEWAWRRVFERAFGHEPIYLIARRHGQVAGILPLVHINSFLFGRTLTSLPFLNYGGVVADADAVAQELLAAAAEMTRRRRCGHVELRHRQRRFPTLPCKQHKVTMLLRIEAELWDRLDRKVRNQIRKAQKSGLVAEQGGAELLKDFYAVFARNMRDLGTPVYSRRLFEEVLEAFPDRARVHVVRLGAMPVAAGIAYRTGTTVEVPWASSVRDHNSLCPNHLLYWSVIETAVAKGCDRLDFGRSTPDEGTFKFKQQWGAEPLPLHWEYLLTSGTALPNASPTNPKFRVAIELWKRLPLAIANRVGPAIVRSIP